MIASDIRPGWVMRRKDTGELLYTVAAVARVPVFNPELGAVLEYVRAECLHADGVTRPHFWLPGDTVHFNKP